MKIDESEKNIWKDLDSKKPQTYKLVDLKIKNIYNRNVKTGWWDGDSWQGLRLTDKDVVLGWRNKRN